MCGKGAEGLQSDVKVDCEGNGRGGNEYKDMGKVDGKGTHGDGVGMNSKRWEGGERGTEGVGIDSK